MLCEMDCDCDDCAGLTLGDRMEKRLVGLDSMYDLLSTTAENRAELRWMGKSLASAYGVEVEDVFDEDAADEEETEATIDAVVDECCSLIELLTGESIDDGDDDDGEEE